MEPQSPKAIDLLQSAGRVPELWSPRVLGSVNETLIKVARVKGEFVWHSHPETDEFFMVIEGELTLQLERNGIHESIPLRAGQFFVVPRGVRHCPVAKDEAKIMLLESAGVLNTGSAGLSDLSAPVDVALE